MTLYDVSSDYTLDSRVTDRSRVDAASAMYTWRSVLVAGVTLLLGYHRDYDHLHYVRSVSGLDGLSVWYGA